jgi:hypothetical protein
LCFETPLRFPAMSGVSISRLTPPNYVVGVNVIHLTIPMKMPFTPDYDELTKNTVYRFIP